MKAQGIKFYDTPIGKAFFVANDGYIIKIETVKNVKKNKSKIGNVEDEMGTSFEDEHGITHYIDKSERELIAANTVVLNDCERQLAEYFKGERKEFTFKYKNIGTKFRKKVWKELEKIPYGTTCTYKDIARSINDEKASRAVGGANNNNNIWIVVPCHRVIGFDGSMTGFGGGIDVKEWLLEHEKKHK